jgi:hypothetical protein
MKERFDETVTYKLVTCGKCLLAFYVPESLTSGSRWQEPVWCPSCGRNAHRTHGEVEKLRRQNAGLRGALARLRKGARKS